MKKLFSLLAIAAVAATTFTSCKDDKDKPAPDGGKPQLTLSVDKTTVAVGAEGTFTIKSSIKAPKDIAIVVAPKDLTILSINPITVTIPQGKDVATGTYKGTKEGTTQLTITVDPNAGATVKVGTVDITVGEKAPELETLLECNADNAWSDMYFANEDSFGFTLWFNNTVLLENAGCDYYGTDLALSPAEKGADITALTMMANPDHIYMGTNKTEGYDKLPDFSKIGKAQYVVFCVTDGYTEPLFDGDGVITNPQDFSHDKPQIKGWALVTSDGGDNVILHEVKFPATKVGE